MQKHAWHWSYSGVLGWFARPSSGFTSCVRTSESVSTELFMNELFVRSRSLPREFRSSSMPPCKSCFTSCLVCTLVPRRTRSARSRCSIRASVTQTLASRRRQNQHHHPPDTTEQLNYSPASCTSALLERGMSHLRTEPPLPRTELTSSPLLILSAGRIFSPPCAAATDTAKNTAVIDLISDLEEQKVVSDIEYYTFTTQSNWSSFDIL